MEGLELQPVVSHPMINGCHHPIGCGGSAQSAGAELLRELGFSCVCDGSLHPGWLSGRGLRAWGTTSVLVSLCPCCACLCQRLHEGQRDWCHATEMVSFLSRLVSFLPNAGRDACAGNGYLLSGSHVQAGSVLCVCVDRHGQWQPLPQWRAAPKQDGQQQGPGAGCGARWDSPGKPARAQGCFQAAASAL